MEGKVGHGQLVERQERADQGTVEGSDQEEGRKDREGVDKIKGVEKRDTGTAGSHGFTVRGGPAGSARAVAE